MGQDTRSLFQYLKDEGYNFLIGGFHVKGQVTDAKGVSAWGYGGQTVERGDWIKGKPSPKPADQLNAWKKQVVLCEHELPGTAKHDPLAYLQNRTVDWLDHQLAARELLKLDVANTHLVVEHEYPKARIQDKARLAPILEGSIAFTRKIDEAAACMYALQNERAEGAGHPGPGASAARPTGPSAVGLEGGTMRTTATVVLGLFAAGLAAGEDWPQWRGPAGNGVSGEKGLPVQWSAEQVAWKARLGGQAISSPIVSGDRVFVTSQSGRGTLRSGTHPTLARGDEAKDEKPLAGDEAAAAKVEFLVEAFARKDGKRLWHYRMPAEGELPEVHQKHNLASPSPVTDGTLVFAWFGNGQLVALERDGTLAWQRHLGKDYGPFSISWGHGSSPALVGDRLILLCDHDSGPICSRSTRRPARRAGRSRAPRAPFLQHAHARPHATRHGRADRELHHAHRRLRPEDGRAPVVDAASRIGSRSPFPRSRTASSI